MSKPQKLESGSWRIQWFNASGRRCSETFKTEAAAKAGLRRKLVEVDDIRSGRAREKSDMTVEEASKEWLRDRPPKRAKDDRSHLENHILPFMRSKRLPEVNAPLIERFIRHLEGKGTARPGELNEEGRKLKPNTIKNVLITLRKMMNDLGYPTRIRYKVGTEDYSWLKSPAEVASFLEECKPDWFRVAAELAVYAGLRKGEVAGLTWSAIDHDRGIIHVERSYDGPTKSKHVRYVPLAPELSESLKRWRMRTGARSSSLVVLAEGKPITEDTAMAARARRACKRAGVTSVKFHELRDTYASHLAERVSLPIVGAVLGHADVKTTARYAHVDTESLARDPRLHLTFQPPTGKVVPLRDTESDSHCTHSAHESQEAQRSSRK